MSQNYPFSALVGQREMCLALILGAVNPNLGGVLIRGERGTGKSTAARSLAALLPAPQQTEMTIEILSSDGPECVSRPLPRKAPFVDLPLGASEDRLVGTLDVEAALGRGQRCFEPGLLARAHTGLLYVDEVNLLPDHLVDLLLDAAASKVNVVEREGLSVRHPCRFLLVGTMNPEEGDLRPQFLDRFGLAVDVKTSGDVDERCQVVRRRVEFEADADSFCAAFQDEEARLNRLLAAAVRGLAQVLVHDSLLEVVADICAAARVDGLRADITLYQAARALAAWEGRSEASLQDVRRSAPLVLLHRQRRAPFEPPPLDRPALEELIDKSAGSQLCGGTRQAESSNPADPGSPSDKDKEDD